MLGDLVEYDFSLVNGDSMTLGQAIGSVEGFKAVADLYGVASGVFAGGNPALGDDPALVDSDPYDGGWLYEVCGEPDPGVVNAHGYAALLDSSIDRLLRKSDHQEGDDACLQQDMS